MKDKKRIKNSIYDVWIENQATQHTHTHTQFEKIETKLDKVKYFLKKN